MELVSDLTFSLSLSPAPAQLAGVVFLGVGLWAWSEKVGVTVTGTLSGSPPGSFSFNCPFLQTPPQRAPPVQGNGLWSLTFTEPVLRSYLTCDENSWLAWLPCGRVTARGQGWASWDFEPHEHGELSLLFPEAPSHPGACPWLCPGQAWGYFWSGL